MIKILLIQLMMSFSVQFIQSNAIAATTSLDTSAAPVAEEEISNVFKEMGVVQRKAMKKASRFVFSSYLTLDFSSGPYTNYSIHVNPGYAFSDFFEVYFNLVPYYIVTPRAIVDLVSQLELANGQQATITAATPKYQYGVEVLWAPLYGKDSLGLSRVIRSDTFLKFGLSQIQYDSTTGLASKLGVGKSFFLGKSAGLRLCVDYGYIQSVLNSKKSFRGQLLLETGFTYYL